MDFCDRKDKDVPAEAAINEREFELRENHSFPHKIEG